MKLEKNVTERVTKTEKVLTISESEYDDVVESVSKSIISDIAETGLDPIIELALVMKIATFAGKLHASLFGSEEE